MTICTCGHDHYDHASGGACMFGDCACTKLEIARESDIYKSRTTKLWEQQHAQMVACTSRLLFDADVREAQARLLELLWWVSAIGIPGLLTLVAWVVVV